MDDLAMLLVSITVTTVYLVALIVSCIVLLLLLGEFITWWRNQLNFAPWAHFIRNRRRSEWSRKNTL